MKKKAMGYLALMTALVLAAGMISGCSGGKSTSSASESYGGGSYSGNSDASYDLEEEAPAMAAEEMVADGDMAYEPGMDSTSDTGSSNTAGEENDALKIVYTGSISIETTEYDKTVSELKELFAKYGIKTASSSESDSASYYYYNEGSSPVRTLELTLRVPADHFNEFFDATGTITGSIRSKSTDSQDLTKQYNDRAVQIESLEIQQQNLLKMMEAAETVEDMILIEDRLSEIRTQLRKLNSANEQIDYDVAYSEVTMYIREVKIYTEAKEQETFLQRITRSISESAESFLENMQDLLVALIYLLPYIVIIAVLVFLFRKPIKALRERHKEKSRLRKEARMKKKAEKEQAKRSKYEYTNKEPETEKKEQE